VGFISVHQSNFSSALNQDCILSTRMRGRMKGPVARRFFGFANELSIYCQARSVLKLVRFGPHHEKSQPQFGGGHVAQPGRRAVLLWRSMLGRCASLVSCLVSLVLDFCSLCVLEACIQPFGSVVCLAPRSTWVGVPGNEAAPARSAPIKPPGSGTADTVCRISAHNKHPYVESSESTKM